MGIFSSKKKTYVTSVAYPLGEDDGDHTPYLQYTVLNAVMQQRNLADSITQGYLRGQGISLRNAFRYARDHYEHGVPKSSVAFSAVPDIEILRDILEVEHAGYEIVFKETKLGTADYIWWGNDKLAEDYGYDPYLETFETPPTGVDVDAVVAFDIDDANNITALVVNADTSTYQEIFPATGFARMRVYLHAAYQTKLVEVDGPTTTTRAANPGEGYHIETTEEDPTPYVHVTTQVVTTVDGTTATDVTTITTTTLSRPKIWLYRLGQGTYPLIDAWMGEDDLVSPYYPSIPLRVNNVDVLDEANQDTPLYKTGKKLLNKLGIDIEDLRENINDNEDIDEIDYCYVVFGVNLNAKSQECRRYLFRFFEHLQGISEVNQAEFDAWSPGSNASPPTNILKIYSEQERTQHHDIELQWQYINSSIVAGKVFPGAKINDVDIAMEGTRTEIGIGLDLVLDKSKLVAKKQITSGTYLKMEIVGLTYDNYVYNGKAVSLTAYDAMVTPSGEEEEEGFIIPLNYEIIRNTPMVEVTDLAYQCNHLVFNCYKVVKQKWYQRGIFKIIIVILSILIIVFTWGAGTPAAATLMASAFVGVGLSLTAAIVLAATLYVLGMMILMNIISKASVKLFGEQWGALIGVIASFVAMNWGNITSLANSAATNGLSSIITAQTVMQATTFLANAYSAYAQGQLSELAQKAAGLWTDFNEQMKEIERLTELNLDTNADLIDIHGYTQASFIQLFEMPSSFLQRTLLTGSDICGITSGLIENFAAVGVQLPTNG